VVLYRFGSWTYRHVGFKPLRILLKLAYVVLEKIGVMLWGIHIHPMADIGPGLYIGHWGGVLIGPVKMGADCNIAHQVTIGLRADGTSGLPVLGDRVWVGVGSVIFGAIHIGDGVTIGPLTVVSRNLPPRVLVIGNPMRVLRRDYDNRAQIYGTPRAGSPPESLPSARR
jgi:serine O-acetyltransferase